MLWNEDTPVVKALDSNGTRLPIKVVGWVVEGIAPRLPTKFIGQQDDKKSCCHLGSIYQKMQNGHCLLAAQT